MWSVNAAAAITLGFIFSVFAAPVQASPQSDDGSASPTSTEAKTALAGDQAAPAGNQPNPETTPSTGEETAASGDAPPQTQAQETAQPETADNSASSEKPSEQTPAAADDAAQENAAPPTPAPAEADVGPRILVKPDFDFYGSLRVHMAVTDGTIAVDNNGSRVGINSGVTVGKIRPFGHVELGVNLVLSNATYNADANQSPDDFLRFTKDDGPAPVSTRLGYVGIEFGKAGVLTLGKQWSTYYNIAGLTDYFWVFGGDGHATYTSGTDGGPTGTGRADRSLQYKIDIVGLEAAIQGQFTGDKDNLLKSWGGSLRYSLDLGLTFGVAYNQLFVGSSLSSANLYGYDDKDGHSVTWGAAFKRWGLEAAVTASRSWNMQLAIITDPDGNEASVVYASWGIEALVRYVWRERVGVETGYIGNFPVDPHPLLDPDFRVSYVVAGATYRFTPTVLVYTEEKFDLGTLASGAAGNHIFTLGIRFGFSTKAWIDSLLAGRNR